MNTRIVLQHLATASRPRRVDLDHQAKVENALPTKDLHSVKVYPESRHGRTTHPHLHRYCITTNRFHGRSGLAYTLSNSINYSSNVMITILQSLGNPTSISHVHTCPDSLLGNSTRGQLLSAMTSHVLEQFLERF